MSIERLIRPRSVAIIGASDDPGKLTGRPLAHLQRFGYVGRIFPVNPRVSRIGAHRCYPDVKSLPEPPDVALILVGSSRVVDVVRDLAAIGTGSAIVLAGGFGESGPEGLRRQQALKDACGAMRLPGPNTIGLVNVTDHVVLSASGALPNDDLVPGAIALISQSGGILGSMLSRSQAQGIGFSKLIATGNEADLDVAEVMDYPVDDPATRVIALYLEGLRKPAAFRAAAMRAAQAGKPVVAFKVGRSESGVRSAVSHTGALAGSDAAYDALFRQLGIIRAERYSDLLDLPQVLTTGRTLKGRRLAVVTSTGGAGSLVADAAGLLGFDTPPPDPATAERLIALQIPDAALDRNPIDVTLAGIRSDVFRSVIDSVLDSPTYDAIAVVAGSSSVSAPHLLGDPLRACFARTDKPIVVFASPDAPLALKHLNLAGIPTFAAPEACAAALSALWRAQQIRPRVASGVAVGPADVDDARIRALLRPGALDEHDSKALFAAFGIPATCETRVASADDAATAARSFAGNVVVKAVSRHVLHKSEAGGVAVNVAPGDVAATCAAITQAFTAATGRAPDGFLVQELVTGGVELILGFNDDTQLGPTILLGMGGVAAEVWQDTSLRLAPLSRRDAEEMIDELKSAALLRGFRGRPAADTGALVDAMLAFSAMVSSIGGQLAEAEINPLFVLPKGRGVKAGDAVVVVKD